MRELTSERLLLRDPLPVDWEALNQLISDPEAMRHMHFAKWDEPQRRDWFASIVNNAQNPQPDAYNWMIIERSSNQLIGWLGIGGVDEPSVEGERDFGYLLAPSHWNRGLMTEALKRVISYEFELLGTPYISGSCETSNHASARVMQKAGMQYLKTVFDSDFEGNWAERHHYGIAKPTNESPFSK